jgi:serine/threonine protein kinase
MVFLHTMVLVHKGFPICRFANFNKNANLLKNPLHNTMESVPTAHSIELYETEFAGGECNVYVPRLIRTSTTTYTLFEKLRVQGTYGLVFLAKSTACAETVLVKLIPPMEIYQPQTDIIESHIHKLVETTATAAGLPAVLPRLIDVFTTIRVSNTKPMMGFVMEYLRGESLTRFLLAKLMRFTCHANPPRGSYDSMITYNDTLILTVMAQIAGILLPLQTAIGFNHRDLHGQNIIMCSSTTHTHRITIGETVASVPTILGMWPRLIDLGFACTRDLSTRSIFEEEPWKGRFSAGRDLCHLAYYVLVYIIGTDPAFGPRGDSCRAPISSSLRQWLTSLVTIQAPQSADVDSMAPVCLIYPCSIWNAFSGKMISVNACHKSLELAWTNVYHVLNARGVEAPHATPEQVLKHYVGVVTAQTTRQK